MIKVWQLGVKHNGYVINCIEKDSKGNDLLMCVMHDGYHVIGEFSELPEKDKNLIMDFFEKRHIL